MYNAVLLAVDLQSTGSYSAHDLAAREVAAALIQSTSPRLHVLGIYQYDTINTRRLPLAMVGPYRDEQMYRTDTRIVRTLDAYIAPLATAGMAVSTLWRVGPLREAVVQAATAINADLLIVGTPGQRKRFCRAHSVLLQLSQEAPCPVLLVSPGQRCDTETTCVVPWEQRTACASHGPPRPSG